MSFRNILKKKDKSEPPKEPANPVPEFTFLRTTTNTQEVIHPPYFPDPQPAKGREPVHHRITSHFRRSSRQPAPSSSPPSSSAPPLATPKATPKATSKATPQDPQQNEPQSDPQTKQQTDSHGESQTEPQKESLDDGTTKDQENHRLSQRFHIRRHSRGRSEENVSANVPTDLPSLPASSTANETEWEKRATLLAQGSAVRSRSASMNRPASSSGPAPILPQIGLDNADLAATQDAQDVALQRPQVVRKISDAKGDVSIQEAIRLHDSGDKDDLARSTAMFGTLADPDGENNALAQVLYGLALRHGWGIEPSPSLALSYLSTAASNSAAVEAAALTAGSASGGAAKGELVLAIYELANSFRHGWGVDKDPVAARQYYETAANLGDVDAMVETATCYVEGIGGPKDKWRAAQYLRRAEKAGKRSVGESWIWKGKYDDPPTDEKAKKKKEKKEKK